MRAAWTQVNCGQGLGTDDVFYREWTPSGWSGVIKQVTNSSSNSYNVTVAVDASGVAHLIWSDDQGFSTSNFKIWYSKGQGTDFSAPVRLFSGFFPDNAYEKDSSLDGGFSAMHLVLSTNLGESSPNKETYYSYAMTVPGSTPTPAVTPTPCIPGNFSDVRSTDFFYNAVRDLALHNVMSGYGDCTFRPSNNLTRGQAAKIVVTGSNVPPYTPATPTFRDVAVTDPFYQYVEAAYHSGVISGYTCGTGCLEFRSGFNVTRGQFAKMIKGAFALPTFTPATPTFRDVPRTDPFFSDIETVVHNGIVSGYSCGTNCLEFRPGNLITRGQAAKMVYLARAVAVAEATATATAAATDTPIVVTATPTATLFVITATPTNTAVVVTSTPTITSTPSNTPTSTWTAMPTLTPTRTPTP